MSAKWRALQHRHRYTYSAVIFPDYYIQTLNQTSPNHVSNCKSFYSHLNHLVSLNSTYAQLTHVKKLALSFSDLLASSITNKDDNFVFVASRFYLEILFLENSLPLHKTLLGVLGKVKNFHSVIEGCFRLLCEEYGGKNGKGRRFCVSRSVLSVMGSPKLGYLVEVVEECGVLVGLDIVWGLKGVILDTNDGSRPSPIVMEQCQEALSCMYYLLQKFPSKFSGSVGGNDENGVLEMTVTVILSLLKSSAFSRDCLVAAGVSFCAALQACLTPDELGLAIVRGIFCHSFIYSSDSELLNATMKIPYKGNLFTEIDKFPVLNRICLIRGILTAVPRTVLNTPFVVPVDGLTSFHTILYDGILPELCNYCENPIDSHFNFHALTVMQICLQQIKTCIQANLSDPSKSDDLISEEMGTRILRIVWNNLEDTLSQTVKQVHLIFDLFLDIQSSLNWAEGSDRIKKFLRNIASDLLRLGPRCKGRYVPLASLTRRLGAMTILDMNPDLLFETSRAYIDDDVCCAVTAFLKCFLECLRDECWSKYGVESGFIRYRAHCLRAFLYGLASGIPKLRSNLNTYAVPVLLEVDVDSIFPMLSVSVGQCGESNELLFPDLEFAHRDLTVEQQVAVLISLLKVSRSLALIEGDIDWCEKTSLSQEEIVLKTEKDNRYATVCVKGISIKFLVAWLILALTHVDETLRVDAAESLFLNPKTSSLPSSLELSLMKEAVLLNMRCCSTAFQMKLTSLFRKFFSRVRTALERQLKQGIWQPLASNDNKDIDKTATDRAEDLFQFMKWLSNFLFFSVYPSAPYERKIMAMDLMLIMNNAWSIVLPLQDRCDPASTETILSPYSKAFTSPDSTLLLVGSIVDSWDRLRENSFRILLQFPSPLPGISSPEMNQRVIVWAKKLVCSPRVRESDAGALTMRLIFKIYVLELGWIIKVSSNVVSFHPRSELVNGDYLNGTCSSATIEYVNSLIDWLRVVVEVGEKDLSEACKNSFVHGILLTLRYTFEELDWNSSVVLCSLPEMKHALEKLLDLVMRITALALWVVSADALHLPEDMDDMMDDDVFLLDASVEMDVGVSVLESEVKNSELTRVVGPSEQIVMVGCWLAMKEVVLSILFIAV